MEYVLAAEVIDLEIEFECVGYFSESESPGIRVDYDLENSGPGGGIDG